MQELFGPQTCSFGVQQPLNFAPAANLAPAGPEEAEEAPAIAAAPTPAAEKGGAAVLHATSDLETGVDVPAQVDSSMGEESWAFQRAGGLGRELVGSKRSRAGEDEMDASERADVSETESEGYESNTQLDGNGKNASKVEALLRAQGEAIDPLVSPRRETAFPSIGGEVAFGADWKRRREGEAEAEVEAQRWAEDRSEGKAEGAGMEVEVERRLADSSRPSACTKPEEREPMPPSDVSVASMAGMFELLREVRHECEADGLGPQVLRWRVPAY